MNAWIAMAAPYLKLAALGLWEMHSFALIVPLYLWLAYGALSMMLYNWDEEEQLADKEHLKRASVGQMMLALVLPLIPLIWLFLIVQTSYFTLKSLCSCKGIFKFLDWKPFE